MIRMESIEGAAFESIKRQPERLPDGKLWKFHVPGLGSYTKAYILENWGKDEDMRKAILERYMDLFTHMAGKAP